MRMYVSFVGLITDMRRILTNSNFNIFAETVAAPSKPTDFCPQAMERLMVYLKPYIVAGRKIKFKFKPRNHIRLIDFSTPEEALAYQQAWDDYLKACSLIEDKMGDTGGSRFQILVQFLKFRQAAELIRAPYLALALWHMVQDGKSGICACNFKETISKITSILVQDYNIPRSEISLIWGGQGVKKAKKSTKLSEEDKAVALQLFGSDISLLRELGLIDDKQKDDNESPATVSIADIGDNRTSLRLGTQSKRERQSEIDKFQRDKSKICLFSFKAGGVGLSLHQETPDRRVRESILAPTYSAIELVQGLGRGHRLTSCSDTEQTIVYYKNTIEAQVAARAKQKLKCLAKAVKQNDAWNDLVKERGEKVVEVNEVEKDNDEVETDTLLVGGGEDLDDNDNEETINV